MLADPHAGLRKPLTDLLFLRHRTAPDEGTVLSADCPPSTANPVDHAAVCAEYVRRFTLMTRGVRGGWAGTSGTGRKVPDDWQRMGREQGYADISVAVLRHGGCR